MADLPDITEVERLTLRAGDRLIVHVDDGSVTAGDADAIAHIARGRLKLPPETPILVMAKGMHVSVVGDTQP